jgi:23S rRNA pseudouridine1911/1915/1917 synthase
MPAAEPPPGPRLPTPLPRVAGDIRAPPESGELHILAPASAQGQRIDRFLAEAVGTLSRSRVKALIEQGLARRDGTPLREPDEAVRPGALYTLKLPPPAIARPAPQDIPITILYEDPHLIVLDKPAGLVVHPAPGNEDGTLVNALLGLYGDSLPGIGGERRPGIVHRLDKDTSGVMVVAKTQEAMTALTAIFAARDLDRAYLALAWGVPTPPTGAIEDAIGRDPHDRKRMAVRQHGGKAALTHYRTLRTWHGGLALIECRLATGRTHQIRVHLASRGHPVVGDPVYLRRIPAAARLVPEPAHTQLLDFPRQALHAARLGFRHPITEVQLSFETPIPADFNELIALLETGAAAGGVPAGTRLGQKS